MSLEFVKRRMFEDGRTFDYVVIPVNCEGVAGKGLALEMKRRYVAAHQRYREMCEGFHLMPGMCVRLEAERSMGTGEVVILATTKGRWRNPSDIEWIHSALSEMRSILLNRPDGTTVAIPALGCGLGGLKWSTVKGCIEEYLGAINHCDIVVYCGDEEGEDGTP